MPTLEDIFEMIYPIGSIYENGSLSTNPSVIIGFGTWAAFGTGRVLVAIDDSQAEFDTNGLEGGAKTHTLSTAEIPAHTHVQNAHTHTQNAHSHVITELRDATTGAAATNIALTADASSTLGTKTTAAATAVNQDATAVNQNAGGGGAHNNLQPYRVVFRWIRTA